MLAAMKQKWDKLTSGWLGSLIYIFLGFAIALGINTALGLALHTDTPVVAVMSDSMYPTLLKGDMIIVYGDRNAAAGDIIVFDSPMYSYPIIHRVWNVTDGKVRTKGDNNAAVDPWEIETNKIHGKAGIRVPLLGWVKKLLVDAIG